MKTTTTMTMVRSPTSTSSTLTLPTARRQSALPPYTPWVPAEHVPPHQVEVRTIPLESSLHHFLHRQPQLRCTCAVLYLRTHMVGECMYRGLMHVIHGVLVCQGFFHASRRTNGELMYGGLI
eukprot:1271445-Rhodomonas_salina.2